MLFGILCQRLSVRQRAIILSFVTAAVVVASVFITPLLAKVLELHYSSSLFLPLWPGPFVLFRSFVVVVVFVSFPLKGGGSWFVFNGAWW